MLVAMLGGADLILSLFYLIVAFRANQEAGLL